MGQHAEYTDQLCLFRGCTAVRPDPLGMTCNASSRQRLLLLSVWPAASPATAAAAAAPVSVVIAHIADRPTVISPQPLFTYILLHVTVPITPQTTPTPLQW